MIRAAEATDLHAISALERDEFGPDAWSHELVAAELHGPGRHFVVAVVEESVVGYAVTRVAGDAADLTRIAVAPAWRRRGVASALLRGVSGHARGCGADRMLLEVAADNHGALELYRRAGFSTLARRPRYYRDGSDALVLHAELASGSPAVPAARRGRDTAGAAEEGRPG